MFKSRLQIAAEALVIAALSASAAAQNPQALIGTLTDLEAALAAARMAAAEQRMPGHSEVIEYEDEKGRWHTETAAGSDRPDTDVEDTT